MITEMLPVGSVVMLKEGTKRAMIMGFCQKNLDGGEEKLWDYAGCLYPEGYLGPDKTFLFNRDQIVKVYALGYQDEEQFAFKAKLDVIMDELRSHREGESD